MRGRPSLLTAGSRSCRETFSVTSRSSGFAILLSSDRLDLGGSERCVSILSDLAFFARVVDLDDGEAVVLRGEPLHVRQRQDSAPRQGLAEVPAVRPVV